MVGISDSSRRILVGSAIVYSWSAGGGRQREPTRRVGAGPGFPARRCDSSRTGPSRATAAGRSHADRRCEPSGHESGKSFRQRVREPDVDMKRLTDVKAGTERGLGYADAVRAQRHSNLQRGDTPGVDAGDPVDRVGDGSVDDLTTRLPGRGADGFRCGTGGSVPSARRRPEGTRP